MGIITKPISFEPIRPKWFRKKKWEKKMIAEGYWIDSARINKLLDTLRHEKWGVSNGFE